MSTSIILKSFDLINYSLSVLSTNAPPMVKFISGKLFTLRIECITGLAVSLPDLQKKNLSFKLVDSYSYSKKAMQFSTRVDQAPPLHPSFNGISSTHVISKSLSPCLFDKSLFKSIFSMRRLQDMELPLNPPTPTHLLSCYAPFFCYDCYNLSTEPLGLLEGTTV